MSRKQMIALIGLFFATVAIIAVAFIAFNHKPNTSTYITDSDTGEVYNATTNNTATGGTSNSDTAPSVILFGIQPFIATLSANGYSNTAFATNVRDALTTFASKNLHGDYSSITLRPQNMTFQKNLITGQIRLGEGSTIVPIEIEIVGQGSAALVTIDGGSHGGKFVYVGGLSTLNQTLYTIEQTNYSGPDVTVEAFTYREAALNALEQLGYNIPDLKITFTNYQDPF